MSLYINTLQIGETVELFKILRKNRICITKKARIGVEGYLCPRFLREISILKKISNPPSNLVDHPGRKHIIKLLDVYVEKEYVHFDMEYADGSLNDLKKADCLYELKEKILSETSLGLQYIHDLGYDHCDLSFANIVYFGNINKVTRFAIIDFGNSIRPDRSLTAELSTPYTMSPELIKGTNILNKIKQMIYFGERGIENCIKDIKKYMIHRKSDIWSLGAISYLLHTNNFYRTSIEIRESFTDKDIMTKTKLMLIEQHDIRPIIYYCKNNTQILRSLSRSTIKSTVNSTIKSTVNSTIISSFYSIEKSSVKNCNINNYSLYYGCIKYIIDQISYINNKKFLMNYIDEETMEMIVNHTYLVEMNTIKKILKDNMFKHISVIKLIQIIRSIILWLITHIYMNNIWQLSDIKKYVDRVIIQKNMEIRVDMIKKISTLIMELNDWDLDQ